MELAWSAKFTQTPMLSRPGISSYSQLSLRKKREVLSVSLYRLSDLSICCRNLVNHINFSQTSSEKSKRWKYVSKALAADVYDSRENEAAVGMESTVDGSLNGMPVAIEAVGTASEKESKNVGMESTVDGSLNGMPVAIEAVGTASEKESKKVKEAEENNLQPLKWPLWLLGPSILLATGAIPTLWLPFSSIFSGCNITSLLSLTGLDGIFNIGATLFLLIADCCARRKKGQASFFKIPFSYKFWNLLFNLVGFIVPAFAMAAASYSSLIEPKVCLLSFASMLGPYQMLLSIQVLAELLTWHWESPVWLIVPVVYEAYRLLQLSRGLELGIDLAAPSWLMEGMKGLVAWWVLVLGMQLMKIAWFVGQGQTRQEA